MFLEVEDETRDFITIFKKDFPKKRAEKRKEYRGEPAYPPPLNILNGPYKKCLNTRRKNEKLPLQERSEDPQEALNRLRDRHPRLKEFFPETVPNEDLIEKKENEERLTTYQSDYSRGDYSPRVKIPNRWKDIELPDNWVISETIQVKSYRDPWKIATDSLVRVERAKKPPDNLTPNQKEREILRVRTGDTEYNATIDATGNYVIEKRPFGPPLSTEPRIYSKKPNGTPSECSQILTGKKFAIPSNVI